MSSFARAAAAVFSFTLALSPLVAQPPAAAPSAEKTAASDAEQKLAIALRSYSLLDAEADRLRAANAKLTAENAALEAKLADAQTALPAAAQAAGLREQLRQTQAQMVAYAEENAQLRHKLATGIGEPVRANAPLAPATVLPVAPAIPNAVAAPVAAPATAKTHLVAAGDTLAKISQTYYGTPNRWNEIREANQLRDEKSLIIGRTLVIP